MEMFADKLDAVETDRIEKGADLGVDVGAGPAEDSVAHRLDVVKVAQKAALGAGITGALSVVGVIGGEVAMGEDFVGSLLSVVAGWLGFASTCLLALGITGLLVWPALTSGRGARGSAWVMQFATTVMGGCAATLPLVVVGTHERFPELVNEPPVAVPATYILSGLTLAVAGIALAVALRRSGAVPTKLTTFLIAGSIVTAVPAPTRHFVVAFAVAALLGFARRRA